MGSCEQDTETLQTKIVEVEGVAMQYHGTSADSTKLIVRHLIIGDGEDPPNCFGCDGEGYGYGLYVASECVIDSLIVGPGDYLFPFDVEHPCVVKGSAELDQRFEIRKYELTDCYYEDYENSYPGYYVDVGQPITAFDSLGYQTDF